MPSKEVVSRSSLWVFGLLKTKSCSGDSLYYTKSQPYIMGKKEPSYTCAAKRRGGVARKVKAEEMLERRETWGRLRGERTAVGCLM